MNRQQMADALIAALSRCDGLIVNTDSDGLLSAILLARLSEVHRGVRLPVVGFYDNERLWLACGLALSAIERSASRWVFADADVRLKDAVVVSQHVVHHPAVPELRAPPSGLTLINPNYLDVARNRPYRAKYPFSTAAWIWALAPEGLPRPSPSTPDLTGLLWAQDGGHRSVAETSFRENCLHWALELLPELPLSQAAAGLRALAAEDRVGGYLRDDAIVARAESAEALIRQELRWARSRDQGWRNQQWCFSSRQQPPVWDPGSEEGRAAIQDFMDALGKVVGLRPPAVEPMRLAARGRWRRINLRRPPLQPPWTRAFSLARTGENAIALTADVKPVQEEH